MTTSTDFQLFTSIRYDPALRENKSNDNYDDGTASPFYMLSLHRDRILEAAKYFGWTAVTTLLDDLKNFRHTLEQMVEAQSKQQSLGTEQSLKVRILFNQQGQMNVDCAAVPPSSPMHLYPKSLDVPATKPPPLFKPSPLTGGAIHSVADDSPSSNQVKPTYVVVLDTEETRVNPHLSLKTTYRDHYDKSRTRVLDVIKHVDGLPNKEVVLYNTDDNIMEASLTTVYFNRHGRWVTPPLSFEHGGQMGTTRRWALANQLCVEEEIPRDSVRKGEAVWLSNGVRGFQWGFIYDFDELKQV